MGRVPEFWGRYINHRLPVNRRGEVERDDSSALTPDEVQFLHRQECRIGVIYNGGRGRDVLGEQLVNGRRGGNRAATHADALCRQLRVPASVCVYLDAEDWDGDVEWFRAWYQELARRGRRVGIYGRPVRMVENPAHPARRYGLPLERLHSRYVADRARAAIEAQTDAEGAAPRRVVIGDRWGAELTEAMTRILGSRPATPSPQRSPAASPFLVWSNEPRRVIEHEATDRALDATDIPTEFVPARPPAASGVRTVVWQYIENGLFVRGNHGAVDMNLATETGYASMW